MDLNQATWLGLVAVTDDEINGHEFFRGRSGLGVNLWLFHVEIVSFRNSRAGHNGPHYKEVPMCPAELGAA
ncbi:hypothetical protein GCM10027031_09180 [Corynebacterium atrinae]